MSNELLAPRRPATALYGDEGNFSYYGALEDRWGSVTPWHGVNLGITDRAAKDRLVAARFYVDHPGMTQEQFLALPVSEITRKFMQKLWSAEDSTKAAPYMLLIVSDVAYQYGEKAQLIEFQEDDSTIAVTGGRAQVVSINAAVYNTPVDPWLTYLEHLWNDLVRAGKLARHRLTFRFCFHDRQIKMVPLTLSVIVRARDWDIAVVAMTGAVREITLGPQLISTQNLLGYADLFEPEGAPQPATAVTTTGAGSDAVGARTTQVDSYRVGPVPSM